MLRRGCEREDQKVGWLFICILYGGLGSTRSMYLCIMNASCSTVELGRSKNIKAKSKALPYPTYLPSPPPLASPPLLALPNPGSPSLLIETKTCLTYLLSALEGAVDSIILDMYTEISNVYRCFYLVYV
jgi:hypothetical protein